MAMPVVVIVGRPNVGKSSLLNMLARERISIVDPRAGITRDRVGALVEHEGWYFELTDTGGIGIVDQDQLEEHVEEQIDYALQRADLILFVVDIHDGLQPLDQRVAELLRKLRRPVIVVANKVDTPRHFSESAQFQKLGLGDPQCVSALHTLGRQELLDRLSSALGGSVAEAPEAPAMKLAIVGKRNAGKSTLVNALAGEPRMIVSEVPGTTRDAVDVAFERDGKRFVAIDTAGVRKKRQMQDIEYYSHQRALRSIERADVVLHLIEATVPISEVDLKLIRAVLDEYKPLQFGINKWDLVGDRATPDEFGHYLTQIVPMARYAPITFLTAKTGQNVEAVVDVALGLHEQATTRVTTSQLNSALEIVLAERGPSAKRGTKNVKIYYGTQVDVAPPALVFFCNDPEAITENYRRFLENRLRELLPFTEVPMRLMFRSHHRGATRPD